MHDPEKTGPNGIHQINATYDSHQDRIRLSVTAQDASEFRFWITCRYLRLLLKTLNDIAHHYAAANAAGNVVARQALVEMAQTQTLGAADTQSPFVGGKHFPLGEDTILLSKIVFKQDDKGNVVLGLTPENDLGVEVCLNEPLTHVILDLLKRTARLAEWKLDSEATEQSSSLHSSGSISLH